MPRNNAEGQPWLTGATCPGCALPQLNAPPSRQVDAAADGFHRAPEVGGGGLIRHVAQLAFQRAVADPEESLAGELKVVPLHINRP